MFLPTTPEEMRRLGWDRLDVIIVTGDAYIDSPYDGAAVIGRVLVGAGYRAGIIAQPDTASGADIERLGEPVLFWGVTSGCVDSMVANYTPTGKFRNSDDLTPGGVNNRRPDRAVMAYVNLVRQYFKNTAPVVLGGIEASLRRVAHYDYWDNKIRNSILPDSKADILVYGMGEKTALELAERLKSGGDYRDIRGICYLSKEPVKGYLSLPSAEEVKSDKAAFEKMFHVFYSNNDPITASGLCQEHGGRCLVQNPPQFHETAEELDRIYELPYERDVHPYYKKYGPVRALETTRFSITSHRGCYGECNFCAISVHQGRTVRSRSEGSIIREARAMTGMPGFKGTISDIGGPTANMYGIECAKAASSGNCAQKRCLFPVPCGGLSIDHMRQINLLKAVRKLPGVKRVFIGSGIRHDMVNRDRANGPLYLREISGHHISGQLKIAPEHTVEHVLRLMGKCAGGELMEFKESFDRVNRGKKQYLTYYFIAAHPGCGMEDMKSMKGLIRKTLKLTPEQVQIFTPAPSTYSTLMYYTGRDPFSGEEIFVERDKAEKKKQKDTITGV